MFYWEGGGAYPETIYNLKVKQNITVKTQCVNINILLWQNVAVLLDHLQSNIQRYEVHLLHICTGVLISP
jgi:hypothetical protein